MITTPLETAFLPVLCPCYDASPLSPQTPPPGPGLYATPGLHLNNFPALQHLNNFPSLRLMTDQCHWWLYTAMGAKCLKNTYRKNIQKNRECHLWLIFHLFCTYMAPTFCIRCVLFLKSFSPSQLTACHHSDPTLSSLWCQFKHHFCRVGFLDHSIYSSALSFLLPYYNLLFTESWYHWDVMFIHLIVVYCLTLQLECTLQQAGTYFWVVLPPVPRTVLEITQCVCNK